MSKIQSTSVCDIERSFDSLKQNIMEKFIHINYKFFYEDIVDKMVLDDKSSQDEPEEITYKDAQIVSYPPLTDYKYSIPLFANNNKIIVTKDTSAISYDWFKNRIADVADYSEVVPGNYTAVEQVLCDAFLLDSREKVLQWLNQVFLEKSESKAIIANILFAISHLEYEDVYPVGPTLAMLALNNPNRVLVELAIHAFENWGSKDSIKYLESYRPVDSLNQKNWDRVIKYLKENGE